MLIDVKFLSLILFMKYTNCLLFEDFFIMAKSYQQQYCELPKICQYKVMRVMDSLWNTEFISGSESNGIECDLNDVSYEFDFNQWLSNINTTLSNGKKCEFLKEPSKNDEIIIEFKKQFHRKYILDKMLNMMNFVKIINTTQKYYNLRLTNLNGFDVNLYKEADEKQLQVEAVHIWQMEFINTRLEFFVNKSLVKSCDDLNISSLRSIFQIRSTEYGISKLLLSNCKYQENLCPLVFKNAYINRIFFRGLIKSFYKTNVLSFSSISEEINSYIYVIVIYSSRNIDLDLKFLNPSVFKSLSSIYAMDQIRSIDANLFVYLKRIEYLEIEARYTKKLMHKGIDWIRAWNKDNVRVDFNDSNSVRDQFDSHVNLKIRFYEYQLVADVFPDEDFCIYKDYPFEQLVILSQRNTLSPSSIRTGFTCTFLWLTQYYSTLVKIFPNDANYWDWETRLIIQTTLNLMNNKSNMTNCDFKQLIELCDRENYQVKEIWDVGDTYNLNLKFIASIIIINYGVCLFGIVTNSIVVWIISSKKTAEIFKDFKQYSYLRLNSIFNVVMLVIQLLSWISECSNTFDVFCPESRKFLVVQFFKIIFTEGFITALRFMCNFAYLAFSLNRISLIGKDHGSIVNFFSKVSPVKYTIVTSFISLCLSIVKAFRYKVNYDHSELSYPIENEADIWLHHGWDKDLYFISNLICDLLNYIVFVTIHIGIDIYMVVKLRNTLTEKSEKFSNKTNIDVNEVVNKAIKMVVLNTAFSIFFKIPITFMSIVNVFEEFNSKFAWFTKAFPKFENFSMSWPFKND